MTSQLAILQSTYSFGSYTHHDPRDSLLALENMGTLNPWPLISGLIFFFLVNNEKFNKSEEVLVRRVGRMLRTGADMPDKSIVVRFIRSRCRGSS